MNAFIVILRMINKHQVAWLYFMDFIDSRSMPILIANDICTYEVANPTNCNR